MNEVDWNQEKPTSPSDIKKAYKEMTIVQLETLSDEMKSFEAKAKSLNIKGDAKIFHYQLAFNDDINWYVSRNRFNEINFMKRVIEHKGLSALHEFIDTSRLKMTWKTKKDFGYGFSTTPFDLSAKLAYYLHFGGAYEKMKVDEAWALANDFVEGTYQNRFEDLIVWELDLTSFGDFFYQAAWDFSLAIFDKSDNTLLIIVSTDTN